MNKKRKIRWRITIAAIVVVVVLLVVLSPGSPVAGQARPLSYLQTSDIEYIDVCLMNGRYDNLTRVEDEEGISEIIDKMHTVLGQRLASTPGGMGGMPVGFFVRLKSGEELSVETMGTYMIINGEWYKVVYGPSEALDQLGQNIMKTGFADISWEAGERPFADLDADEVAAVWLSNGSYSDFTVTAPEAVQGFVRLMKDVTIERNMGRYVQSPNVNSDYDYYVDFYMKPFTSIAESMADLGLTVRNPYVLMYGYTYTISTAAADALDKMVCPYLEKIFKPESDESWQGLSVEIKDGSVSANGLTLVFQSFYGDTEFIYGEQYSILRFEGGKWVDVKPIIESYGWDDIAHIVSFGAKSEFEIDWEWIYGSLPEGKYRIEKPEIVGLEFEVR